MKRCAASALVALALLGGAVAAANAQTQPPPPFTHDGVLSESSPHLPSGEWAEVLEVPVPAGQMVCLSLTSTSFTPYLIVTLPTGRQVDQLGANGQALVVVITETNEPVGVIVTSAAPGGSGPFRLTVQAGSLGGELAKGASVLETGEYSRVVTVQVPKGDYLVSLAAATFDPYLIVHANGQQINVDNLLGGNRSLVAAGVRLDEPGQLAVQVTSHARGETGPFRLLVTPGLPHLGAPLETTATLAEGDWVSEGRWVDIYALPLPSGERVVVELRATGWQPRLIAVDGAGQQTVGAAHERGASLSLTNSRAGTLMLLVEGNQPGQGGPYELIATPVQPPPGAEAPPAEASRAAS